MHCPVPRTIGGVHTGVPDPWAEVSYASLSLLIRIPSPGGIYNDYEGGGQTVGMHYKKQ